MRLIDIVLRNLWRRKARSVLTCLGIALAVATTLTLVGFSSGLERSTEEVYTGRAVDLVVVRAGVTQRLTSSLDERVGKQILALSGVRDVNPSQTDIVSFGDGSLVGIPVHGWPADGFAMRSLVMSSGRRLANDDRNGVMLGQSLASTLGKKIGDELEIELSKFRVVGIYAGLNVYENLTAITLLPDLQNLMDRADQVTEFQVMLEPEMARQPAQVDALRAKIEGITNDQGQRLGLSALPAREFVEGSTEAGLARAMAWGTSIIAIAIGSLGMLNTMLMSVLERVSEIGVLKALGWSKSLIAKMILLETLLLSAIGAITGVLVGVVLVRVLSQTRLLGGLLQPDLPWTVLAMSVVVALVIGGLGGWYPATRAAKLSVVEALHYE